MASSRLYATIPAVLLILTLSTAHAATLYVTPQGGEKAAGTEQQPLSLTAALQRASTDQTVTQIILAGGEYFGMYTLGPRPAAGADLPPRLTIQPAQGQEAVLTYARQIDAAEPVAGSPGLWSTKTVVPPGDPHLWERDSRVRYATLSNKESVAAIPASCFVDHDLGVLYFRTSDDKSPKEHKLFAGMANRNSRALGLYRANVTLEGLTFRDYVGDGMAGIQAFSAGLILRGLRFDNCSNGWAADPGCENPLMENCTGVDVGQPVYCFGKDVVVRNNRFEKSRDRFMIPRYPQEDCAYQVYHPGSGGTFEGNFSKGYFLGIFIKANAGRYVIRHNTIIDTHEGISWSTTNVTSDASYNIVVDADFPTVITRFPPTFTSDHNLFWKARQLLALDQSIMTMRGADRGKFTIYADPRFVDPAGGDYRLLPDSPALMLKDEKGLPAGAFGVAPVSAAAKAAPTLSLDFKSDSQKIGKSGDLTFHRDPWIGGGVTRIRDLTEENAAPQRLVTGTSIVLLPNGFDAAGKVTSMRIAIDDAAPAVSDFDPVYALKLPDVEGEHRISVEVQNDRGLWSAPARAVVRVDRQPPKIVGEPRVVATDQGVMVSFRASEPCLATLEYGDTAELGNKVESPSLVRRNWSSNDGGEWVETWTTPRTEWALPVAKPDVKTGQTLHFRLSLVDQGGLKTQTPLMTAKVAGSARTLSVALTGADSIEAGTEAKPFRTIQYAVDRALPGDRVVIASGVYSESVYVWHGGVDDANRITIEAQKPGSVTIDSARRELSLISLEHAPFVTIRGLRLLYFKRAGVYAYESPHAVVERCVSYNGPGWVEGTHVFAFRSPNSTVTGCLAVGSESGFYFLQSPGASVTHNTYSQGMYGAATYTFSARGSEQLYNSFAFSGNDIYSCDFDSPDELKTFHSDYNNLGTNTSDYNHELEKTDPTFYAKLKAQEFKTSYPVSFAVGSKAVVNAGKRYMSFREWQETSGQDAHSVFADPQYVKPLVPLDSWDWRIKPSSPNISGGEKGKPIGAQGVVENAPATK